MAIEIKEYIGATFTEQIHHGFNPINLTESAHYVNRVAPNSLMVDIEGLHSVVTRNDTFYTDEAMRDSEKYWVTPYERPVIMHHNEKDGITIGRVKRAYWTDKNTRSGTGALRFITNIGHKEGLEGINNGSLSTVSVGLIAHDVRCSICGKQIELDADGHPECGHYKGAMYDDKHCYWIIHKFEPKELSFVIVPSDPYAHILRVYKPDRKDINLSENKNNQEVNNMFDNPFMDLMEESQESIRDLTEASEKEEAEEIKKTAEKKKEEEEANDNNNMPSNSEEDNSKEDDKKDSEGSEENSEGSEENNEAGDEENKEESTENDEQGNNGAESNKVEDEENTEESKQDETKEDDKKEGAEEAGTPKVIEEEVKKDIDSKKEDIYKNIEVKLQKAETENETLKKEIANLKKQVADMNNKLQTEKSLKESAEAELMQFRAERKRNLAEQVNTLRKKANLDPEKVEDLMEASEDTLHFTIKNLKEFSIKMIDLSNVQKIESNISISESRDNSQKTYSKKDTKENKNNMNLEEAEAAVLDILAKAFGGF